MFKIKKLNNRGFSHEFLLFFFVVVFAVAGVYYLVASRAETAGFSYLATHPQASQQSTALGKTILALRPWNGKIYAGYGDFGANTGPVAITPFDPAANSFAPTPELGQDLTEAIGIFRVLNGNLYAPSTDPRGGITTDFAEAKPVNGAAAWDQIGPQWPAPENGVGMAHAFDMATLGNGDLWLVGVQYPNDDAVAFRSLDGGATWTKSLVVPAAAGQANRFYGIGTYNGKVYVQAHIMSCSTYCTSLGSEPNSHVFDGAAWSKGPNLAGTLWHPEAFAGKMVYISWPQINGPMAAGLMSFNGSSSANAGAPTSIYEYAIDGNTLYILGYNGNVYSTSDLVNWYQQATAPTTARSIAVFNGQIYVGTTDSKIYGAPVNTTPPLVSSGTTSGSGKGGGGGTKINNGKKPN